MATPADRPASAQKSLTGLFVDTEAAEGAYRACLERGYDLEEVNVIVSEGTRKKLLASHDEIQSELASRKAEGGELGGPKGGRVGLLVTVFAAVGAAVTVPALGFVVGPIAVALTAAGAAGVAGGLIAALGKWGIPAERTRAYETAVKKGAILIMVEPRSTADARALEERWKKLGGRDIHYG